MDNIVQYNSEFTYTIQLDNFNGPLDLLLHLIKKHKIDIFNIPIAFITKKYLEYLEIMKQLNLDIASEYLEMAATLAYIKSRSLLPKPAINNFEEDEDPRSDLVEKLLHYQKIKFIGMELFKNELLGRDVFTRIQQEIVLSRDVAPANLTDIIFVIEKLIKKVPPQFNVDINIEKFSVVEKINQLRDTIPFNKMIDLNSIINNKFDKINIILTFLAVLEMCRLGMIKVFQHTFHDMLMIFREEEPMMYLTDNTKADRININEMN